MLLFLNGFLREKYYKFCTSDRRFIERKFQQHLGRQVNLTSPKNYNDKLQWLKLNWYDPLATKCADKYKVREYIKRKIGKEYLNDLLGVYETVDEINLDELPQSFVLKGTHGSGYNIICKDKNKMDWKKEFKKMNRWLKTNYFWRSREWVYKDIKPRIICEKYMRQKGNQDLLDYRFFCFNGEPRFITIDFDINDKEKTRRNLYDLDWNLIEAEISYPREEKLIVKKPGRLEEMIGLSRKLAEGFPHARVDFYYIDNRIIFGEITFFHQNGMAEIRPAEFEREMGTFLELPLTE